MALLSLFALVPLVIGSLSAGTNTTSGGPAGGTIQAKGGVITHIETSTSYETFGQRLDIWRVVWHAFLARPIVGYGPNQFRVATAARYPPALIHAMETDVYTNEEYTDGHDVLVEFAVSVGIVGLALFLAWLYFCVRRRRGPLVLFALVLLASELAEPLNPVITTLLLVALGASVSPPKLTPSTTGDWPAGRWLSITSWGLAALALAPAVGLVIGDIALAQGTNAPPVTAAARSDASTAETLLGSWPGAGDAVGHHLRESGDRQPARSDPLAAGRRLAQRTDASALSLLAAMEVAQGNVRTGRRDAAAAVAAQPWLASALDLLGAIDQSEGNRTEARGLYRQSLSVLPGQTLIEDYLSGSCIPVLPGSSETQTLSLGCRETG